MSYSATHSFTGHLSFYIYLLDTYYVTGIVPGTGKLEAKDGTSIRIFCIVAACSNGSLPPD
jgi:hypothetical protein